MTFHILIHASVLEVIFDFVIFLIGQKEIKSKTLWQACFYLLASVCVYLLTIKMNLRSKYQLPLSSFSIVLCSAHCGFDLTVQHRSVAVHNLDPIYNMQTKFSFQYLVSNI